ncbi:MAG TPA: hypothetical protein VMU89_12135 [Thermomicrobiaceae bacterium]|nr:hypothetical protein [Thermomicrobiaceae bacterium]
MDEDTLLRIVAASPTKEGDLIVEDAEGNRRLFIGSAAALSRGRLNADFLEALFRRQVWEQINDGRWYRLSDLRRRFAEPQRSGRGSRPLVAAFAGRHDRP